MDPAILSILLLLLGFGFIVMEVFIPSGGVLGCLAIVSILGAIVVAFTRSIVFGAIILSVTALVIPVLVAGAIRLWPSTPMGRRILIGRPKSDEVLPNSEEYQTLKKLVGQRGKSKTQMLPSGLVTIAGRDYDAVSEGMPIQPGQTIQVVEVETNHIVVRPSSEEEPIEEQKLQDSEDDVLSRPIDSLGLDPFDDPLA